MGPGVLPDMYWEGVPPQTYDKTFRRRAAVEAAELRRPRLRLALPRGTILRMIRAAAGAVLVAVIAAVPASGQRAAVPFSAPVRTLSGAGNNLAHPDWGKAGTAYTRVATSGYADGVGAIAAGPSPRYVSNRIFNDLGQNLFSENGVTQWGWAWGQFLDHDFGLRAAGAAPDRAAPLRPARPARGLSQRPAPDRLLAHAAARREPARRARAQYRNELSSYIDASNVYGLTPARLDWLRAGPLDGRPANNGPGCC